MDRNITLKCLSCFVNIENVTNYKIKRLTRLSTVESFDYKESHIKLLRCDATAVAIARVDDEGKVVKLVRICDAHNICAQNSKAIRKFCLEIDYKTYSLDGEKCAPKWSYLKEDLLTYLPFSPLKWAIETM